MLLGTPDGPNDWCVIGAMEGMKDEGKLGPALGDSDGLTERPGLGLELGIPRNGVALGVKLGSSCGTAVGTSVGTELDDSLGTEESTMLLLCTTLGGDDGIVLGEPSGLTLCAVLGTANGPGVGDSVGTRLGPTEELVLGFPDGNSNDGTLVGLLLVETEGIELDDPLIADVGNNDKWLLGMVLGDDDNGVALLGIPLGLTLGIVVAKVGTSDGCELGSLDGSVPGLTEDGKLLGLVVGSLLRATLVTVEGLELGIPLGTSEVALGL